MGGLRTPVSLTTRTDENSVLDGTAAPTAIGMIHGSVNRTYLSTLEKGASYPGLEIVAKLATVLEVEPNELLRISPARPSRVAIRGNRVLINNALRIRDTSSREASDMADLDPERFTLRQAAQARDDFAQVHGRAGFRQGTDLPHPDAQGSGICPPAHHVRLGRSQRRARHPLVGGVLAALPVSRAASHRSCTHRS